MINEQDGQNEPEIDSQSVESAINEAMTSGLRLSYQPDQQEQAEADGSFGGSEPTPEEVWEYFAANRDKTFDKTTYEGKRLYELFKIANKDKNDFTMQQVKEMANIVAKVPFDIVSGVARNPLKAPLSAVDGMARDLRDLYGILAQSEDPDSILFRFKDYINGTGTIEDQIDQFNEARWFNNRSTELEEGKATVLEDWVPADYKDFVKNLIDPKLANALSYIGLETPHLLLSPLRNSGKQAIKKSVKSYKTGVMAQIAQEEATAAASEALGSLGSAWRDNYDTVAKRMKDFSMRVTGSTIAGTADVVAKPFSYVQQKIAQGSTAVAETAGSNPTVLRNAAQTALADAGERAVGEGLTLSPIRSTIFSLGVKPITEYASVLGNEIVDYANGVVQVKSQNMGMGMLERLATKNGSRVPMSAEALAVAKFTNVVVGWPASMAVPVLKRAVGDAAYMGTLGYLSARGAGAASGVGIGFAWGGLSGSLRHVHNVYSQNQGHLYMIENFDSSQINMIDAKSPDNARHIRSTLKAVDAMGDNRISATVRAVFSQSFTADPEFQYRFGTREELIKEFGPQQVIMEMAGNGLGAELPVEKNGAKMRIQWINSKAATPETIAHELAHGHLNNIFKHDADSVEIVRQFFGDGKDKGVISDEAMAHLYADYRSKFVEAEDAQFFAGMSREQIRAVKFERGLTGMRSILNDMRVAQASEPAIFDRPSRTDDGRMIPEVLKNSPELESLVQETFAYSYSNSILNKSPDFFLRNPESRSLRAGLENLYMLHTQRLVTKIEEAGVLIKPTNPNSNTPNFQAFMWEDGRYLHMPMLDAWTQRIMAQAMRHGDINVSLMSPERADAYFKQTGKERFANSVKGGKVMKGKAEVDEIITRNTEKIADALDALPENERPRFNVDQSGNRTLDLTTLNKKQWDSVINSGAYSRAEVDELRGLTEVIRNTRAGKPVFNTFISQYLGRTHQVVIDGQVRRLTGSDVPVTNRHFSPYAVELRFDRYDEYGNPLKKPKGHVTIHAVDVRVLNRRRMKLWQRADVRSLFTDFGHYTRTFTDYMHNLSQDSSSRKTSVDRFKPEFGDNAEAVRDVMYETFGGRKRMDESFINAPKSGYAGNADGPNYPFHSLRFELLANMQKQTSVFQETFGTNLGNLPYNHANAYEGVRRNMMVGGFVEYPVGQDGSYWSNHIGYEIRKNGGKLSLFSPFGALIGSFKTLAKAQSYAERHMKSIPQEEGRGFIGTEQGPAPEGDLEIKTSLADVTSLSANMMVGKGGYYEADVRLEGNRDWENFVVDAKNFRFNSNTQARNENWFYQQASIRLKDIFKKDSRLIADYPFIGDFEIVASPMAVLHGGYSEGVTSSRNSRTILTLPVSMIEGGMAKNVEKSLKAMLQVKLQELISFSDGAVDSKRLAYVDGDLRYYGNTNVMASLKRLTGELDELKKTNPQATLKEVLENEAAGNIEEVLTDYWNYDAATGRIGFVERTFGTRTGKNPHGFTKQEHALIHNHFKGIINSFSGKNKSSYVIQAMGSTFLYVNPSVLKISTELEQVLSRSVPSNINLGKGITTYRKAYDKVMMNGFSGFHHVSKMGDRARRDGGQLSSMEERSNLDAIEYGMVENATPRSTGEVVFIGEPNASAQTAWALMGVEDFAIFSIGGNIDPTKGEQKNVQPTVTYVTAAGGYSSLTGLKNTTDTLASRSNTPYAGMKASRRGIQVSINAIMAANGLSPYLHGEGNGQISNGGLYKHVKNGEFSKLLAHMYRQEYPQKFDALMQRAGDGINPFEDYRTVRRIATSIFTDGITTPRDYALFQYATALSQILVGEEMIKGTEFGQNAVRLMEDDIMRVMGDADRQDSAELMIKNGFYDARYLGSGSVNEGVARILLLSERMGVPTIVDAGYSSFSKAYMDADGTAAGKAEAFRKGMADVSKKINEMLVESGFDKSKPASPVIEIGSTNMMVGGFRASLDANERMMESAGMLRMVFAENGKMYKAFEFSDKGASLLLGAVDEKIHLLPFINDLDSPSSGFENFIKEYQQASLNKDEVAIGNAIRKIPSVALSDILKHDLLYKHYPRLKNVRVSFVEGFGAGYYPNRDHIVLGIDRLISGAVREANGLDADSVIIPDNVRSESVLSSLIHEVQHAIQRAEAWTQTADISESAQYKRGLYKYLIRNMMGLSGPFYGPLIEAKGKGGEAINLEVAKAMEAGVADAEIAKALELSEQEIEKHLVELLDSPLAQRVGELALPNAIRLFEADAMSFERLAFEFGSGTKEYGKIADMSRALLELSKQAQVLSDSVKSGLMHPDTARTLLVGPSESLLTKRNGIIASLNATMGRDVSSLAFEYLSHHARYLDLMLDVVRVTDSLKYRTANGPAFNANKIRDLAESLGLMQYYGQTNEKQAYETAERRKMTQEQLNAERPAAGYSGSIGTIGRANSLTDLGLMFKRGQVPRVSNMMIGGLGMGKEVTTTAGDGRLEALRRIARLSTISYYIEGTQAELRRLGRYVFSARGWEVIDGKARLVYKTGVIENRMMSEGRNEGVVETRYGNRGLFSPINTNFGDGSDTRLAIANGLSENMQNSISMEELARLVDGTVVLENELRTPSEAVDAVYREDFPEHINAEEIGTVLAKFGVSNDGIRMANVGIIQSNFAGVTFTREELANVLAINHQFVATEFSYGSGFGRERLSKAVQDSKPTPEMLTEALRRKWGTNYDKQLPRALQSIGVNPDAFAKYDDDGFQKFGMFKAVKGRITFEPVRPDFIPIELWDAWVANKKANGTWPKDRKYIEIPVNELHAIFDQYPDRSTNEKQVDRLNELYAQRCLRIKPFFQHFMSKIDQIDDQLKFSLIDEAILVGTRYEPESIRTVKLDPFGLRAIKNEELGSQAQMQAFQEILGEGDGTDQNKGRVSPFGPSILLGDAFRTSGSLADTAMFGTNLLVSPTIGLTANKVFNYSGGPASDFEKGIPLNWYKPQYDENGNLVSGMGIEIDRARIGNPYYAIYHNENLTATSTLGHGVGALKSLDTAHEGLMMLIKQLNNTVEEAFERSKNIVGRIPEGTEGKLEMFEMIEKEKERTVGMMKGLHGALTEITEAWQRRNTLLVPYNASQSAHTDVQGSSAKAYSAKGYLDKNGALVIEAVNENVLDASTAHTDVVTVPYIVDPQSPHESKFNVEKSIKTLKDVVMTSVTADLERAFIFNGEITTESGPDMRTVMRAGDIHIALNSLIGNGIATPTDPVEVTITLRQDNMFAYTGVHAMHSSLYQLAGRRGIAPQTLALAIQSSPELMELLQQTHYNGSNVYPVEIGGGQVRVSLSTYALGMVPILSKAFAKSSVFYKDGKLQKSDILSVTQRAEFESLLADANKEVNIPESGTLDPEYENRIISFLTSLEPSQRVIISEMCSDVNSNMLLDSNIAGMQGMAAIETLGTYPAMEAILPNFKEQMREQMREYIKRGAIQWEQGVSEKIADPIQRKSPEAERPYVNAVSMLLREDNVLGFARFLLGLREMDKFPAYEITRGEKRYDLTEPTRNGMDSGPSVQALFRMSVRTAQEGWASVDNGALGAGRKMVLDGNSEPLKRQHSLNATGHYANNSPVYLGVREIQGMTLGQMLLSDVNLGDTQLIQSDANADVAMKNGSIFFPKKAVSVSRAFARKHLVDMVIREARKANSGKIGLQPARTATYGRRLLGKGQIISAGESGLEGQKGYFMDYGIRSIGLGGFMSPISRDFSGALPYSDATFKHGEISPYGEKASMGFAFKRLEDGRIVINISGDVLGYKNFSSLSTRSGWGTHAIGVNLEEALGYSHSDGLISHTDPKLFGQNVKHLNSEAAAKIARLTDIHGGGWRIEALKKARKLMSGVHEVRDVNQKLMSVGGQYGLIHHEALERIASGTADHNNQTDVMTAMALVRDSSTDNYITLTIPANATAEDIKAHIYTFLLEKQGVLRFYKDMYTGGHFDYNRFSSTLSYSIYDGDTEFARHLMGEKAREAGGSGSAISTRGVFGSVHQALERHVKDASNQSSSTGTLGRGKNQAELREANDFLFENLPHLAGDIEKLAQMAVTKDHGYLMPDLERQLAMNGDKRAVIEALFPNRPELAEFAWDNAETSNVSIVPKREGKKIVSYLVGYDIPSGIDQSTGRVITARKVTSVRTLSEAEALKAKYTISTSKAEMARAIETLTNETGRFSVNTDAGTKDHHAPVRRRQIIKSTREDRGYELSYSNSKEYTVGDLDLSLTKEQAEALSAQLSVRDSLQADVINVSRPNMMIGDPHTPKEIESMLRRKINFGVGQGRVEFSSKLMSVIAYGKMKSGKNLYPDTLTGTEWAKFIKENGVSKDEVRMTGLMFLLADNASRQVSRLEIAEFLYTVYPRNFRQDKGGPITDSSYLLGVTGKDGAKRGNNGEFLYPFIFNAEGKEKQAVEIHTENIRLILTHIDTLKNSGEEGVARANAVESAIGKTLDELVDVFGMPNMFSKDDSLQSKLDAVMNRAQKGFTQDSPAEYVGGTNRLIRPAQLELIVRAAIDAKLAEASGITKSALGDIGVKDPWNWGYSDVSNGYMDFPHNNEFGHLEGNYTNNTQGVLDVSQVTPSQRNLWQQGVITANGSAHEGYATYRGAYTSSIWLTELWSDRMEKEFDRFTQILKKRSLEATNAQDAERINSIILATERVRVVRSGWNKHHGGRMGNAGHYGTNMMGMFQLGHIRATAGVMLASHGPQVLGEGTQLFDETDAVTGIRKEIEPTYLIEEIQSDTFQYKTFGDPVSPAYALPDTIEQAEALRGVSDLTAAEAEIKSLEQSMQDTMTAVQEAIGVLKGRGNPINRQLQYLMNREILDATSQFERHLIFKDFIKMYDNTENLPLEPTSGTVKLSPEQAEQLGVTEIPYYEWKKGIQVDENNGVLVRGITLAAFRSIRNALYEINSGQFGILDMKKFDDSFVELNHAGQNSGLTPSILMLQFAQMDEQAHMSATEMNDAFASTRPPNFDFDAMAERLIERVDKAISAWMRNDPAFNYNNEGTRLSKLKALKSFSNMLKRLQSENPNFIVNSTLDRTEGFWQSPGQIEQIAKASITGISPHAFDFFDGDAITDAYHFRYELDGDTRGRQTRVSLMNLNKQISSGRTIRYRMRSPMANNGLSQLLMDFHALFAVQHKVGDTPKRIGQLKGRVAELRSKLPVAASPEGKSDPNIITTQPYGIEDIYRPISLQGTVLRAANAGYRQIAMTDARHHFVRGWDSAPRLAFVLGNRKRAMTQVGIENGKFAQSLKALRLLPEQRFKQLHGGLFERLSLVGDLELEPIMNGSKFEHNGINANLAQHMVHAMAEAEEVHSMGDSSMLSTASLQRAVAGDEPTMSSIVAGDGTRLFRWNFQLSDYFRPDGGNALVGLDGKPLAYRKGGTGFWQSHYGTVISGDKTDYQRMVDGVAANPDSVYLYVESQKASGYVGNYGLPLWYLKLNYTGQNIKSLQKLSTDSFERPVLEIAGDKFRIIDPKTSKLIIETDNPAQAREAMLYHSKYLGSLPYISKFIAEWKPAGGYVFSGYGLGVRLENHLMTTQDTRAEAILNSGAEPYKYATNISVDDSTTFNPADGEIGRHERSKVFRRLGDKVDVTSGFSHTISNGAAKSWRQIPDHISSLPMRLITKLQFGLEPTSENMAKVMKLMNSNGTTVMRFAPEFQTDAQRNEFRRKVIAGIPNMMVGGVDEGGRPQANPELLRWLDNVAKNYDKAGKLARAVHDIQTGALSREEAASKHGTTLHNIQVTESRLRKRGVPITPRMGGKAPLSQAELRVNEETGKYGLSPRAIQRIVELRQQGYSLREIAKDVGVSSSNVHKYLARKNMDGRLDEDRNRMPDEPDTMP
jgi:hypothetical protein